MRRGLLALALLVGGAGLQAQTHPQEPSRRWSQPHALPFLSNLRATRADPVYTTYAAALERSRFLLDEGYHLRFYDPASALEYTTDDAGDLGVAYRIGSRLVSTVSQLDGAPVIRATYGDVVRYEYRPAAGIHVQATFVVYSSRVAVEELAISSSRPEPVELDVVRTLRNRRAAFANVAVQSGREDIRFTHEEPPDGWTTEHRVPHVAAVQDAILLSAPADRVLASADSAFSADEQQEGSGAAAPAEARTILAARRFVLRSGETVTWRLARAVAPADSSLRPALTDARRLLTAPLTPFIAANERLYRRIPAPPDTDPRRQLLYWGAFTLLRQVMLPPEAGARRPYYVFSREPQWGWGHGGQVFHESLSMLAYALMDPDGAMASQRFFADRQHADGYIPYRIGPYLEETIPHEGHRTTSAPWFAWETWEIYRITRDRGFLRDMYPPARRYYEWIAANRDADRDGLYEWGAHAVLESVRDGDVAVWDQVGWPSNFEALDLNTMMVSEAEALASIAGELGLRDQAESWRVRASALATRIERTFWDRATGFYYNVDSRRHGFTFKTPDDLKREEIIGFLPLWAGTASRVRADTLIRTLTDTTKFWRRYGVPSLSAHDPYYNPRGYWNGPVWVEWDYLVERGLLRYGRRDLARQLVDRVADGMIAQLEQNHVFWEMYGPDGGWAGHHQVYIWAGLVARMMLDAQRLPRQEVAPARGAKP